MLFLDYSPHSYVKNVASYFTSLLFTSMSQTYLNIGTYPICMPNQSAMLIQFVAICMVLAMHAIIFVTK